MFHQPKRHVPKPEPVGPHRSDNPLFRTESSADLPHFRLGVLMATGLVLLVIGAGGLAYGPWYRISRVTITGTRVINPASLRQASEQYLATRRWLVLPNRTLWVLSGHGLAQHLQRLIQRRLSIESVIVTKLWPAAITVTVAERTPVATWTNGTLFGTVDRHGVIIDTENQPVANLPLITDQNQQTFAVDTSVVKDEVISKMQELDRELAAGQLAVQTYLIPVPVCPVVVPTANTNTAAPVTGSMNTNTNIPYPNPTVTNVNQAPLAIPCDINNLRFNSQEIHVQLKDGPQVYFDRHQDLHQAVLTLKRVLSQPNQAALHVIDVRFGERVYAS